MRAEYLVSGLFILSAAACRGDDNDSKADAGGDPADAPTTQSVTIYDVQSEDMPVGTSVTLRSVVVTAVDAFGGRTGGIYVQEPDGGPYSGVFVFVSATASSSLSPGDLVDVVGGVKDEFALQADETGRTLTEVSPPEGGSIAVSKVGDGTLPEPELLNPWDLAADDAEAEKWEGVLVRFDNVSALSSAYSVSETDATLKEMELTGPFRVGGSLTDLSDSIARDDCFASITGIGDYFFNYKILPRSASDIATGGSNCPEPEATAELCADDLDNDYDGFGDCTDFSCQEAVAACTLDVTVVEAQNGTVEENSKIRLTDVVVTAVHGDGKKLWIQDDASPAAYNGLYVFRPSDADALPGNVDVGSTVTVVGNVVEYQGQLTELTNVVIEASAGGSAGNAQVLAGIDLATLASDKQYEGVLVTLSDVAVVDATADGCTMFCSFSVGTAGDKLWVADDIYRHEAGADACLGELTGVMHYDTFNDRIVILPRNADDVVVGGSCN